MTYFQKVGFFILMIFLLLLTSILALTQIEITTLTYESYDEMEKNGGLQSGWFPVWLPRSVRNIQESHDIDTNESWLTFTFSEAEEFYRNVCHPQKKEEVILPREKNFSPFPSFIRDMQTKLVSATNLQFFRCDQNIPGFLAINSQDNIAYFWQLSH